MKDGTRQIIAPWEAASPEISAPDWPRADFDIACYELLIGLVFMAAPPADLAAWRRGLTREVLREALMPFTAAFEILGEGPRFLQETGLTSTAQSVDMLFIDSAGGSTGKKNADLMVRRDRYPALPVALAAMALYTLQSFAPSGGAGNRTSVRGGGPMVTLVDPGAGFWDVIWANVPFGTPAQASDLPWMRPMRVSEAKATETFPNQVHPIEAFFGMPRRLWLDALGDSVTGVVQKPWGTNYAGWVHPLSPYYRQKAEQELLPVHPKPGAFGYRNWLGVVARRKSPDDLKRRAEAVEAWQARARGRRGPPATLIVAGWAMANMTPRTFLRSVQPLLDLPDGRALVVERMIEAADKVGVTLRGALKPVLSEGEAREAVREAFFARTESAFLELVSGLAEAEVSQDYAERWIVTLRRSALALFDARAIPALDSRSLKTQSEIVSARRTLAALGPRKFTDFTEAVALARTPNEETAP